LAKATAAAEVGIGVKEGVQVRVHVFVGEAEGVGVNDGVTVPVLVTVRVIEGVGVFVNVLVLVGV
jgi:hypothetical protein